MPADNPFVGATSFNGLPVNPAAVRTEFWAVGLRNPWRIGFDPPTGDLWCGDVGQGAWEEVDIIVTGGNYEWAFREGDHDGPKWSQRPAGGPGGDAPLYDYHHGSGEFQGNSVTGGVVYRGNRIPSLSAAISSPTMSSGNIWALDTSAERTRRRAHRRRGRHRGFGHDPSNGDVLLADLNIGIIQRLRRIQPGTFPATLAATGLFADLATLDPESRPRPIRHQPVVLVRPRDQASLVRPPAGHPDLRLRREGNWSLPKARSG